MSRDQHGLRAADTGVVPVGITDGSWALTVAENHRPSCSGPLWE